MDKHLNLVGILNIVYRSLLLFAAFFLLLLAATFGNIFEWLIRIRAISPHDIPFELLDIVPVILAAVATIMLVVSIAAIVGSIGVLKKKEWGRILLIVISFLNLMRIPFGTALGIYSIWVLMNDETIKAFKHPPAPGSST